jgi:hypothetical protein
LVIRGVFEYRYNVYDPLNNNAHIDGDGVYAPATGLPAPQVLSFSTHSQLDAGDTDASTFGFFAGSALRIEGEFFNHFATTTTPDGMLSAYVFGSVTSVILQAVPAAPVPEPGSFALMLVGLGVPGVAARRRKSRLHAGACWR